MLDREAIKESIAIGKELARLQKENDKLRKFLKTLYTKGTWKLSARQLKQIETAIGVVVET